MKLNSTGALILLITIGLAGQVSAQKNKSNEEFKVAKIQPSDKVVPGQIADLLVQGLGGADSFTMLSARDFQITVSQQGKKQPAFARTATAIMSGERPEGAADTAELEMHPYQQVSFVVPRGLQPGEAELVLTYRRRSSAPIKLTIVDHPMRPVLAITAIQMLTMRPSAQAPGSSMTTTDLTLKLERGTKARLSVQPLMDPDDPSVGVVIQFKQGDTSFDAVARVVHQSEKVETTGSMTMFRPDSDSLEVAIPAGLKAGPALVSVRLRANGQVSEAVSASVEITDSSSTSGPTINAPQVLAVTPRRVGAGQALMISIDQLRGLGPDPAKTMILFEQGSTRYMVQPEMNSAVIPLGGASNLPVFMIARPTKQIIGVAKVSISSSPRGEQVATSQPIEIEILDEVLPPEISSVAEATAAELSPLRQMYEALQKMNRQFEEYDPHRRYLSIQATGLDPSPSFVRIRLEQKGKSTTLSSQDISLYSDGRLIVRLPGNIKAGSTILSVENRGEGSYSTPVRKSFELRTPE